MVLAGDGLWLTQTVAVTEGLNLGETEMLGLGEIVWVTVEVGVGK